MDRDESRRRFIYSTMLGSSGFFLDIGGSSIFSNPKESNTDGVLILHPRYYRWYPEEDEEWLEANTDYDSLKWKIPIPNIALVLVDVWEKHYLVEAQARAEEIIQNNLVPLLNICRASGLTVIHAPSPPVAELHPNWVNLKRGDSGFVGDDTWPPKSFRSKSGEYIEYARPKEPREAERRDIAFPHVFHPKTAPVGDEPVIGDGEELHNYCKQNGILFLLYAGFNTNACLITRDYGMLQMCNDRGYETILVRDCTTGMESKYSQATMEQTSGAIQFFEMFGQYTVMSRDIIEGLN